MEENKNLNLTYPRLRNFVIKELGDGLRNLCERRREKIINRAIIIYIKASNKTVFKALDVIHNNIGKGKNGAAGNTNKEVK